MYVDVYLHKYVCVDVFMLQSSRRATEPAPQEKTATQVQGSLKVMATALRGYMKEKSRGPATGVVGRGGGR